MEILKKILAIIGFGAGKVAAGGGQTGTEVTQQAPDLIRAVQLNYQYHRHTYRRLLQYSMIQAIIILVLIGVAGWIIITAHPQDRYFVATVDGRITRVLPLDQPNVPNNEMYVRVGTAVAWALTFGFLDYDQRRIEIGSGFEPEALNALHAAFLGQGGKEAMLQNSYVYQAEVEPSRPGGVIHQNVRDNIYEWVIQVPLAVTRKIGASGEGQTMTRWNVQVLVRRAKTLEVARGFIISSILSARTEGQPQSISPAQVATP